MLNKGYKTRIDNGLDMNKSLSQAYLRGMMLYHSKCRMNHGTAGYVPWKPKQMDWCCFMCQMKTCLKYVLENLLFLPKCYCFSETNK